MLTNCAAAHVSSVHHAPRGTPFYRLFYRAGWYSGTRDGMAELL